MSGLPCPNCGSELAFLAQYQRHYCYSCGLYAPDGFGDRGAKRCPTCTGILSYVAQYERYYCHRCNAYPPEGMFMVSQAEVAPETPIEPVAPSPQAIVVLEPEKVEEPQSPPAAVVAETTAEPEEIVDEEIPSEDVTPAMATPPLIRQDILEAKKTVLMDLSKAYGLDPTGTKEQLRERLLSYADEQERETVPVETAEVETRGTDEKTPEETKPTPSEPSVISPWDVVFPRSSPDASEPQVVRELPRGEKPVGYLTAATAPEIVQRRPPQELQVPFTNAPAIAAPSQQLAVPETPVAPTTRATTHPCPRCGRELSYIAPYDRWYCYSCRAYAPRAKAKFACPTCGAALRWISQYERWWCDSCRRYAPSDLPKPERGLAAASAIKQTVARAAAPVAASIVHRHRSPGSGIGLVGFGMLLFVVYEIFVDLPLVLSIDTGVVVAPDLAFGLRFFAFMFVMVGAILGLSAVRDRR